jgi:nucleoside-diphosphate-sugar epimerase
VQSMLAQGMTVRGTYRRNSPDIPGVAWYPAGQLHRPEQWPRLVADTDAVVHLAALVHQAGGAAQNRWPEYRRVNVSGTRRVARACSEAGVGRVVFVSSIAVYGGGITRVDEQSLTRPEDDYGRSKLEAEESLRAELLHSASDWCILRPPLVYGPGNPGNLARLQRLVARGYPLPFGGIHNCRSFIFVDNLVDAIVTVLRHPHAIHASYVVSDGSDFGTAELVRALAAGSGQRARLLNVPVSVLRFLGRTGDFAGRVLGIRTAVDSRAINSLVGSLLVDSTRFRQAFAWQPPIEARRALELVYGARPLGPRQ